MKTNQTIFLFLFLLCPILGFAQPYYFKHYTAENGLSYNTVFSVLQDSKGFMWFATRDGLNRFDGYSFKVYRHKEGDKTSIGSDFIHTILEDNHAQMWVGTTKGLFIYHPDKEIFTRFKYTAEKDVPLIKTDTQDNIWLIANNELCSYNVHTQTFRQYKNFNNSYATGITITALGQIWVSFNDGTLQKYLPRQEKFGPSYNLFSHSKPAVSHYIQTIEKGSNNTIFVGTTNQGVKIFDCNTLTYRDVSITNPDQTNIFVRKFVEINPDECWIATESGIYIYNKRTGQHQQLKKRIDNPYSLSDNAVYDVYRDREGGIWAATYFGGLNYYSKTFSNFRKYFPTTSNNSLKGNIVREICKDKNNNLWIGTEDGGLNFYDTETKQFKNFTPDGSAGSIAYSNIHALFADKNKLWIGTFEHGLDVMDIASKKVIKHYSAGLSPNHLQSNFVLSIIKTRKGNTLIGTSNGLFMYNETEDNFKELHLDKQAPFIHNLMEDHLGNIWASTLDNGVFKYNPATRTSTRYLHKPKANSIVSNAVTSAFESADHKIWLATYGGGLSVLDPETKKFSSFDTNNGLPSDLIFKILEDRFHNIWITTSKGLVVKQHKTGQFKIYTVANGLLSDQFNYNSGYADSLGNLYFGGIKGMISFNPDDFNKTNFNTPLFLTGFQIDNKEVKISNAGPLKNSILSTDHVTLNHKQSSFNINFSALSYAAPEMTEYAYRMLGINKEWTYLQTNRTVYFTELTPGDYVFEVKVANQSHHTNPQIRRLHISILPPWWATWWAYLFYFIFIGSAFYFITRFFFNREKERHLRKADHLENQKEREIYEAKISFFTHVAHEIKTPLTLIKGPMEKIIKQAAAVPDLVESLHIMDKNTERLLNLTNQLLDLRKVETNSYKLTFVRVNIPNVLAEIFARFKLAAAQKNLSFNLVVPDHPVAAYVDLEAFEKIVSNLFSNAIKYAESKIIVVLNQPDHNGDSFKLVISNDGHLIPKNLKEKIFDPFFRIDDKGKSSGTGIGLPLARFLTELHEGTLLLGTPENSMNTFELMLPIHHLQELDLTEENVAEANYPNKLTDESQAQPIILLVDDHDEILDFIEGELKEKFQILRANNGLEALKLIDRNSVNLIISDIMMPEMDGYKLCEIIKSNVHYSHIPVILLTAKSTLTAKIEGLELGADSYIEKPFSPDFLVAQVESLLENRKKVRDHFSRSPLANISTIAFNKHEESFLDQLQVILLANLTNENLDVELLADEMNMSRPTLYRKIKSISDLTPSELINVTRLKRAAELLASGSYKIYEIADLVGYSSQSRFSRNFNKQFGCSPTEYAQKLKDERQHAEKK
ncbi:ligand-binding sensor domain-containing protein/signal transduction histidine kinase/DNA-binding response OmpR family regulator [Pedobacter sp. UYP30]|uniref:hybrid sensor histidine kinase/response regulator transcription factor n=1 Tax=Pedobacter sp. UYP30 TaxID=1756400 RepID=UPI00339B5FF3